MADTCVEVPALVAVTVTLLVTVEGSATGVNLMVPETFDGESWTNGMVTPSRNRWTRTPRLTMTV